MCLVIIDNMSKQGPLRLASRTCNSSHCITSSASSLIPYLEPCDQFPYTLSPRESSWGQIPRCEYRSRAWGCWPARGKSRTDNQICFQCPDEQELPGSKVVQGRGGFHMKRTLPSFSLEGKMAVVTGGGSKSGSGYGSSADAEWC